jgi:hypothetical protein
MAWKRKAKKATDAKAARAAEALKAARKAKAAAEQTSPRREVLADGTIVETSASMGTVYVIPASPGPRKVAEDSWGWQRKSEFVRRYGGW